MKTSLGDGVAEKPRIRVFTAGLLQKSVLGLLNVKIPLTRSIRLSVGLSQFPESTLSFTSKASIGALVN